ncbi:hypothetical protein M758_UG122800 [Ceratodon purpureus]|nr:hypothetical protein M758_UG122800 [Ceratodon purpureus]
MDNIHNIRFILLGRREYRVGSLVVVKPDEESNNTMHHWVWKAEIVNFFIQEFEGVQEVFFTAKYFEQRLESENSIVPLTHGVTNMQILNFRPSEVCVRPVHQLMYEFIALPMPHTSDGRRFVHAYEFEDVRPRKHLLRIGEPGCCPPYPVVGDVMMMYAQGAEPFLHAVVRRVNPKVRMEEQVEINAVAVEERDDLVGTVDICYLRRHGPRSSRFTADVDRTERCSWHKLAKLMMNFRPTRFLGNTPI